MPVSDRTETADIWYVTKNNKVTVGFMSDFLKKMTDCWHISPVGKSVDKESPLMVLEMGDELLSIMSPSKGLIESFNTKAQNFPEQLTEDDVICVINENGVKPKPVPRAPQAVPVNPFIRNGGVGMFSNTIVDWNEGVSQTIESRDLRGNRVEVRAPAISPRPSLGDVMGTGVVPSAQPRQVNSAMQRILDQIEREEAARSIRLAAQANATINTESEF